MTVLRSLTVGPLASNSYIIADETVGESFVIDAGDEANRIAEALKEHNLRLKAILTTHGHFDHIMGVGELRKITGAEFYIHKDDELLVETLQENARRFIGIEAPLPPKIDHYLRNGDNLRVGDIELKVLHTPGHSPGSVSFLGEGIVFTGDALFSGSIGRTDGLGGDFDLLVNSINMKLLTLKEDTVVYPGHGPETMILREKLFNPFVGEKRHAFIKGM